MGKTWEIGSHTFSIKLKDFPIKFLSCGILHQMRNAWVFSSNFHSMGKGRKTHQMEKAWEIGPGKILQSPSYVENLGNWYSYLSQSMDTFFPLDSQSIPLDVMVYFIIGEIHGVALKFPIAWENAVKSIELEEPGKLVPIFSSTYGYFSFSRFPSYDILYDMVNAWLFPSISNSTRKCSKIHLVDGFYTCSKIWWFLKKGNKKTLVR